MSQIQLPRRLAAHWLALQALVALALASWRIRVTPPERLVAILGEPDAPRATPDGAAPTATPPAPSVRQARRVGRMVQRVARLLPWHPKCLPQALATQWLLRRRAISSVLHLGIADASSMDAHAWVTVDGRYVVGRVARPFTPVASFER